MPWTFPRAQPQHFALVLAYGLGAITTAAAGTGWAHTITPIDGDEAPDRSQPGMTMGQRLGSTILKRRYVSMFVDAFNATFAKDSWVKLSATLKGTGCSDKNITQESLTAKDDAISITLAASGVQGADAATRLDNVHRIRAELTSGVWTDVAFSAVSDASPAVITITAPGAATTDVTYEVLYVPTEPAWCTFPARVTESPMRVSQMALTMGGAWSGSAFAGGRTLTSELKELSWEFANNLEIEFTSGSSGDYANRVFRPGRTQTIKLSREMREYTLQQHIDDNDTFGLHILCEGAEFDTGHNYTVDIVFPMLGVITSPISVDGKVLAEAGDLKVMEDDTYGSVIATVKNLQSAYAG